MMLLSGALSSQVMMKMMLLAMPSIVFASEAFPQCSGFENVLQFSCMSARVEAMANQLQEDMNSSRVASEMLSMLSMLKAENNAKDAELAIVKAENAMLKADCEYAMKSNNNTATSRITSLEADKLTQDAEISEL
jgi:cell shape-determining protein MreC